MTSAQARAMARVIGTATGAEDKPSRSRAKSLPPDPLTLLDRFAVTAEQVESMKTTRIIWRDQIALSHLLAWIGQAGGGKTTIAKFAAGELAQAGFRVFYFQEDAPAGDLPALHEHARAHGYKLLNSTLAGASPDDQISVLRDLAKSDADLSNTVFVLDTLKKYADLMSKGGMRGFFTLMRALTQRGATVLLLGHTNKHRGVDGKLMFEGVGDVRNDVDELVYLDATEKDATGIVTVTMRPDKVRCAIKEATFQIDTATLTVRPLATVVDVQAIKAAQEQRREDQSLIDVIDSTLAAGGMNHTELVRRVRDETGLSRLRVERVIERYISAEPGAPGALWSETRGLSNARYIARMPGRLQ